MSFKVFNQSEAAEKKYLEKIGEICMEELANDILENKYKFQSFHEQVSRLLQKPDAAFQNRIQFKSDMNIINKINEFLVHIENHYFKPFDFVIKRYPVPAVYIAEKFKTLNLRQLYKDFYNWLGKPEMLKQAKGSIYEYADVYPLIYLKIKLEGTKTYQKVKHLVIDEMQDYTPVQYSVIAKLFTCNKTILGDCNQAVNPYSSSNKETIGQVFPNADHVKSVILLNAQSTSFSNGIIVTNASFSKGLEFDQVITPFCSNSNYNSETDKQMLYVAATRAMHKLDITFTKELSVFLK